MRPSREAPGPCCCIPDNNPLCFSRPLRIQREKRLWWTCQFWRSQANALRSAWWRAVRIKPTNGHRDLISLLWCWFLTVWSGICATVLRCKSESPSQQNKIPILLMCCGPSAPLSSSSRALNSLLKSSPRDITLGDTLNLLATRRTMNHPGATGQLGCVCRGSNWTKR